MYFLLIISKNSVLLPAVRKKAMSQVPFLEYITKGVKLTPVRVRTKGTGEALQMHVVLSSLYTGFCMISD